MARQSNFEIFFCFWDNWNSTLYKGTRKLPGEKQLPDENQLPGEKQLPGKVQDKEDKLKPVVPEELSKKDI